MVNCWFIWSWHDTKIAEDRIRKEFGANIRTAVRESDCPSYYELEVETVFPEQMARVEDIIAEFM